MAKPSTSASKNANVAETLDLLFNLYLVGRKMKQVAKHHSVHARDSMLRVGILKLLQKQPRTISYLAGMMSTGASAMSEKVKDLKTAGLLVQIDSSDGRETICELTQKGAKQLIIDQQQMSQSCTQLHTLGTKSEFKIVQKILDNILNITI